MCRKAIRFGIIIPSSNTTAEKEFSQMTASLPWITVHTSRVGLTEVTPKALDQMVKDIEKAASLLFDASVDGICLACTSASFIGGRDSIKTLKKKIEYATGIPSITTTESVVMALKVLGAKLLGLVTPYINELNSLEIQFLQEAVSGLDVVGTKTFNLKSNLDIGRLPSERILHASQALVENVRPDVLFLSCTNMPSIGLIQSLEDEFGISVFSSNSASLFGLLRLLNQPTKIEGFGKLLRTLQAP